MGVRNKTQLLFCGKSKIIGEIETNIPHIVFDLQIEDLEERRIKAKEFNNANEVAAYLGVAVEVIFRNRFPKKRIQGINKKFYAVRTLNQLTK